MKRPPSYSDSFIFLNNDTRLEPLFSHVIPIKEEEVETDNKEPLPLPLAPAQTDYFQISVLFIFKGSLHVLFISVFETTFYFLYVNRSENAGILNTINTYYQPLINNCQTNWSNVSRWLLNEFIQHEVNISTIDAAGNAAAWSRASYNNNLLIWSTLYSIVSAVACLFVVVIVRAKGWTVPWRHIFLENMLFILVLATYEFFFFETIIYKYVTISTPELNQYIMDGLSWCAVR